MYHTAQSFAESNFVFAGSPCIDWEYKFLNFFKGLAYQKFPLRVVSHCEESNFSNFEFEYVRENEIFSKTIFAGLSGSQVCSIHEKNRGRKFRDTASLRVKLAFAEKLSFERKRLFTGKETGIFRETGIYNKIMFSGTCSQKETGM